MKDSGGGQNWGDQQRRATGTAAPGDPPRLRDDSRLGATVGGAFAQALLQSTPAHQPSPARKQKLRLQLGRALAPRPPWFLRPTVVAAVVLGGAAGGSAALGYWPRWLARDTSLQRSSGSEARSPADRRAARQRHVLAVAREADPASAGSEVPLVPAPPTGEARRELSPDPRMGAREAAPHRRHETPARPRPPATSATAASSTDKSTDDTWPVLEAVRALRREHNPGRARVLLAAYLEHHPDGPLAQEALALSIEAALAEHDPAATALAERYLSRYPAGPFRALAQQARAGQAATTAGVR